MKVLNASVHIPSFEDHLRNLIFQQQVDLRMIITDIKTLDERIASWKPQPLRKVK